jgi:alpha-pyrone synthase
MSAIVSIGTANPEFVRSQTDAVELVAAGLNLKPAEKRLLKSVYRATGIDQRYSVLSDYAREPGTFEFFPNDAESDFPSTSARMRVFKENALTLALNAINNCLEPLSGFSKSSISHVITVSCTGLYAPGLDIEIVQSLKLNSTTKRTAVNFMGCYGAFNAMKLADAICIADSSACVLVVCVELCTLHFQKSLSLDNMISNAIFADGAAAVLIGTPLANQKHLSLAAFHCDLLPQTSDQMAWQVGDHGFDIVLSSYVPQAIQSGIMHFMTEFLSNQALSFSDIDFFAIHPGGLKILQACEEALSISHFDNRFSYEVLKQYGNMSSATVMFVLKKIWDALTNQDTGKRIFSCAFGPGLTLESLILKANC